MKEKEKRSYKLIFFSFTILKKRRISNKIYFFVYQKKRERKKRKRSLKFIFLSFTIKGKGKIVGLGVLIP